MSNYQGNIITKNPVVPTGPNPLTGRAPGVWRLNDVAYWIKQGLWPDASADPYFNSVSMLLSTTSLGNANNNLFVDSSGAFNPISRNGNTTQGSATPYSANWSNYFDGSGDYLSLADKINFGTGDFTVEGWVYRTANPSIYDGVFSIEGTGGDWNSGATGLAISCDSFHVSGVGAVNYSSTMPLNQWTHIACTRSGSTIRVFLNGSQVASTTSSASLGSTAGKFPIIGGFDTLSGASPRFPLTGYISNLRTITGTALYTSAFTPPTTALTAISGTSLLTCQSNRFRDASSNNFTITVNGNTRVTDFAPFSPGSPGITYNQSDITNWSGYFDGSGDDLRIASNSAFSFGTGDFTIEGWCYLSSNTGNYRVIVSIPHSSGWVQVRFGGAAEYNSLFQVSILTTAASNVYSTQVSQAAALGRWMHFAFTRSSGTCRVFLDGVQQNLGTGTNPTSFPSSSFSDSTNISNNDTVAIGNDILNSTFYIGNLSNIRMVKGTAVYTSNFTPPTTNLTAISGTSLLTLQNAAFTDNSTNNFIITPNGNVTVTGNSPFNTVGYWSNYFDGSGDYLQMPGSSAFAIATSTTPFTIEGWIYPTASGGVIFSEQYTGSGNTISIVLSLTAGSPYEPDGLRPLLSYYNGSSWTYAALSSTSLTLNAWQHVAAVFTGSTSKIFINGTDVTSASPTPATTWGVTGVNGDAWFIGKRWDGGANTFYTGYISNLRFVNGTAVYTSNFTVPTTPLTAITNTSLLTCQNGRFIDNSTNAFTITANGNTSVQSFDPFYTSTIASNGGSMYFDGSGDYLDGPALAGFGGSGNFTVQAWIYPTNVSGRDFCIYETRGGSGWVWFINSTGYLQVYDSSSGIQTASNTQLKVGQWTHVALVKNGSTCTYYVNAVSAGTFTLATFQPATRVRVGARNDAAEAFVGWICGLKTDNSALTISLPTAPQTPSANTTLLVNGMSAGLFDATAINDMETVSGAQVVTNISKFGGSSAFFNGTGGFLDIPAASSKDSAFGTGDFTVEMWLYFNSVSGSPTIITFNNFGSGDGFFLNVESSAIGVRADGSTPIRASTTVTTGVWYHVAVTRSSGTLRLFQDGVNVGSTTWTTNCTAGLLRIGQPKDTTGATYALSGYMDELRVTKGVARYTTNFTPPTQAFPPY